MFTENRVNGPKRVVGGVVVGNPFPNLDERWRRRSCCCGSKIIQNTPRRKHVTAIKKIAPPFCLPFDRIGARQPGTAASMRHAGVPSPNAIKW